MPFSIYSILDISWLANFRSLSKHNHPSTICFWYVNYKDHEHKCVMSIIPFRDSYGSIQLALSPKSTYYLSLVSPH